MSKVKVYLLEDGGYINQGMARGALVNVTLQRGREFARSDGILIWEPREPQRVLQRYFNEWMEAAEQGEEGYAYWTSEDPAHA